MTRSARPSAKQAGAEADHYTGNESATKGSDDTDQTSESSPDTDADSDCSHRRKRRKMATSVTAPQTSVFQAPSRIKRVKDIRAPDGGNGADEPGPELAPTDPKNSFEALGVRPWLVGALTSMAIRRPTGIQKGCIPEILGGRDCIGGSRTGSGKTVAFLVPILQRLMENPSAVFALILTPTRWAHTLFHVCLLGADVCIAASSRSRSWSSSRPLGRTGHSRPFS